MAHLFFSFITLFNTQLPLHIIEACRADIQNSHHQEVSQHLAEFNTILVAQMIQASTAPLTNFSLAQMVAVESPHEQNEDGIDPSL